MLGDVLTGRNGRWAAVALLAVFGALPAAAQRGAMVVPRNAAQLAAQAAVIVHGRVVQARVEPHPELKHLSTVVVTLRVEETLKGTAGSTFTFRQFIWDIRDRMSANGYRKGQEVLLLMNAPTQYGLSSPAGLEQGRFRILRDAQGSATAVNGYGNAGLFRDVRAMAQQKNLRLSARASALLVQHRSGPVPLDDLREILQRFAEVQ